MNEVKELSLSNIQLLGVEKAIEYGVRINQLKRETKEHHLENLTNLIKATKAFLKQDRQINTKLSKSLPERPFRMLIGIFYL